MTDDSTPSIRSLLASAQQCLTGLATHRLDAEVLLAKALSKERSYLYAWPDAAVSPEQSEQFEHWVEKRALGEPVAYLTGEQEFWSLTFQVDSRVLVPRHETETLVEQTLRHAHRIKAPRIADIGTGSGAIAIAIASERPDATVTANDYSKEALAVAALNSMKMKTGNVNLYRDDLCTSLASDSLDLCVSNPPYIRENDPHLLGSGVRNEPRAALVAGVDGLDCYRRLVPQARRVLKRSGVLLLEHGYDQQQAVLELMADSGFTDLAGVDDDAGIPRVCIGRKN